MEVYFFMVNIADRHPGHPDSEKLPPSMDTSNSRITAIAFKQININSFGLR